MEQEIWKDIPEYEGLYQVSNLGRVRSLDRFISQSAGLGKSSYKKKIKGKLMSPAPNGSGYLQVNLCRNNNRKKCFVHRVVYECFIGPIPEHKEVNHINHSKIDNRVKNLELSTRQQNMRKMFIFYNKLKAEKVSCTICGKVKSNNGAKDCVECGNIKRRKVKQRPSYEELIRDTEELGFCGTGRKYGVSDSAIRKWIKKYRTT